MRYIYTYILVFVISPVFGQDSTATVTFSGYAETFFSFDLNRPNANQRPAFLYNFNRHNEFNLNLGYIKAAYSGSKVRANMALAVGTYMADNYAAEPTSLRNIFEANVGLNLGSRTWLDVGILPSHIGFESAIGKDCPTLTRSLLAENSPYFESGAKLTYAPNEHWTLGVLLLNGWQRIARVNSTPAFGSQVVWKPNSKTTLNWSTYIGNERPDTVQQWRVFNNFYGIFQLTDRIDLTAGFDIGTEQSRLKGQDTWYSLVTIARVQLHDKWAVAGRIERYTDEAGSIIAPDFAVNGWSINLDYQPVTNALLRLEARYLTSQDDLFAGKNKSQNSTLHTTTSLSISF